MKSWLKEMYGSQLNDINCSKEVIEKCCNPELCEFMQSDDFHIGDYIININSSDLLECINEYNGNFYTEKGRTSVDGISAVYKIEEKWPDIMKYYTMRYAKSGKTIATQGVPNNLITAYLINFNGEKYWVGEIIDYKSNTVTLGIIFKDEITGDYMFKVCATKIFSCDYLLKYLKKDNRFFVSAYIDKYISDLKQLPDPFFKKIKENEVGITQYKNIESDAIGGFVMPSDYMLGGEGTFDYYYKLNNELTHHKFPAYYFGFGGRHYWIVVLKDTFENGRTFKSPFITDDCPHPYLVIGATEYSILYYTNQLSNSDDDILKLQELIKSTFPNAFLECCGIYSKKDGEDDKITICKGTDSEYIFIPQEAPANNKFISSFEHQGVNRYLYEGNESYFDGTSWYTFKNGTWFKLNNETGDWKDICNTSPEDPDDEDPYEPPDPGTLVKVCCGELGHYTTENYTIQNSDYISRLSYSITSNFTKIADGKYTYRLNSAFSPCFFATRADKGFWFYKDGNTYLYYDINKREFVKCNCVTSDSLISCNCQDIINKAGASDAIISSEDALINSRNIRTIKGSEVSGYTHTIKDGSIEYPAKYVSCDNSYRWIILTNETCEDTQGNTGQIIYVLKKNLYLKPILLTGASITDSPCIEDKCCSPLTTTKDTPTDCDKIIVCKCTNGESALVEYMTKIAPSNDIYLNKYFIQDKNCRYIYQCIHDDHFVTFRGTQELYLHALQTITAANGDVKLYGLLEYSPFKIKADNRAINKLKESINLLNSKNPADNYLTLTNNTLFDDISTIQRILDELSINNSLVINFIELLSLTSLLSYLKYNYNIEINIDLIIKAINKSLKSSLDLEDNWSIDKIIDLIEFRELGDKVREYLRFKGSGYIADNCKHCLKDGDLEGKYAYYTVDGWFITDGNGNWYEFDPTDPCNPLFCSCNSSIKSCGDTIIVCKDTDKERSYEILNPEDTKAEFYNEYFFSDNTNPCVCHLHCERVRITNHSNLSDCSYCKKSLRDNLRDRTPYIAYYTIDGWFITDGSKWYKFNNNNPCDLYEICPEKTPKPEDPGTPGGGGNNEDCCDELRNLFCHLYRRIKALEECVYEDEYFSIDKELEEYCRKIENKNNK